MFDEIFKNLKFLRKFDPNSGMSVVFSVLLVSVLLATVTTLSTLSAIKIKLSSDIKNSAGALYAAESGIEWCLYRKKDINASKPVMSIFSSGDIYEVNPIKTTYQKGDNKPYSQVQDAFIRSGDSGSGYLGNYNYGHHTRLIVKPPDTNGWGVYKILIKFPLLIGSNFGQIPLNSDINTDKGAVLRFTVDGSINSSQISRIKVYRLLKPWEDWKGPHLRSDGEAAVDSEVTYNSAKHNEIPWQIPGALAHSTPAEPTDDRSPVIDAPISIVSSEVSINIFSAVQAWAKGEPNYGLLLEIPADSTNKSSVSFISSDDEVSGNTIKRPMLSIVGANCTVGNIKSIGTYNGTTRALEVSF